MSEQVEFHIQHMTPPPNVRYGGIRFRTLEEFQEYKNRTLHFGRISGDMVATARSPDGMSRTFKILSRDSASTEEYFTACETVINTLISLNNPYTDFFRALEEEDHINR